MSHKSAVIPSSKKFKKRRESTLEEEEEKEEEEEDVSISTFGSFPPSPLFPPPVSRILRTLVETHSRVKKGMKSCQTHF